MNAFKRYVRSKGIKLECDYPELPHYIRGESCFEPGYIYIDAVEVDAKSATVARWTNVMGWEYTTFNRDGSCVES